MRPNEENRDAIDSIRSFYSPQVAAAEQAAKEYAQLALRSLITMNAGVAVAFPTVAEVFEFESEIEQILGPTGVAIGGAMAAIIAAYLLYFNYMSNAGAVDEEMERQINRADEYFDEASSHRQKPSSEKSANELSDLSKKEGRIM